MKYANNIKSIRMRRGLTREQLATSLDWTVRRLQSYELDQRGVDCRDAVKLATFLNVTTDELITTDE